MSLGTVSTLSNRSAVMTVQSALWKYDYTMYSYFEHFTSRGSFYCIDILWQSTHISNIVFEDKRNTFLETYTFVLVMSSVPLCIQNYSGYI